MASNHSKLSFHYVNVSFYFPFRNSVKDFISFLFVQESVTVDSINFIFCGDEYLLSINQQYLNHDTYTDIITFQISDFGEHVLSDIFISIDRVKENSLDLAVPFRHELLRVMIHGALHLCGYKDKSKREKATMRSKEDFYLTTYLNSYK